jgi:hypothetical protein
VLKDIKAAEGMEAEDQRTLALSAVRTRLHALLRPRHDALLAQFVQFVRKPATREILMARGSADADGGGSSDGSGGGSADGRRRRHDPAALMAAAGGGSSNGGGGGSSNGGGGGGGGGGGSSRPGTAPPAVQAAVQEAAAVQGKQAAAASGAFHSLAVAAVRQKAAVAPPEANFFQIARRQLPHGGGFEAFRAELKPLLICLKALTLTLTLALALALTPALTRMPTRTRKLTLTLTHQAARQLESPSLVRAEMHRVLDAVHSLLVRLALGGLCEEFAAYVPAEARDYWRTLASTSVDGTTGCMERPVSRKENATHQLGYQP